MPPLRIGVVGSGFIANVIAAAIGRTGMATLAAVTSRTPARAAEYAQIYAVPHLFASWQELVASDMIDAVYVATPTAAREPICIAAAQHGKHLLAEKPFASLGSLQAITAACRAHHVAFMDATHFVHHPRTLQLKQELAERIGALQTISTAFFFPSSPDGNIRFDPTQEPTGAYGDMAWYTMRAAIEFSAPDAQLADTHGFATYDPATGAVVRAAGAFQLSDASTVTWNAGYTVGTMVMALELMGQRGVITIDDFVLDWAGGFPGPETNVSVGFTQRNGIVMPTAFEQIITASSVRQSTLMIEQFVRLASDPTSAAANASIMVSERTQAWLDTTWQALRR